MHMQMTSDPSPVRNSKIRWFLETFGKRTVCSYYTRMNYLAMLTRREMFRRSLHRLSLLRIFRAVKRWHAWFHYRIESEHRASSAWVLMPMNSSNEWEWLTYRLAIQFPDTVSSLPKCLPGRPDARVRVLEKVRYVWDFSTILSLESRRNGTARFAAESTSSSFGNIQFCFALLL